MTKMTLGTKIYTKRFCTVTISAIFQYEEDARACGYCEATYYEKDGVKIYGKHIGTNRMRFAAIYTA